MENTLSENNVISDYDFVNLISDELASFYKQAMSLYVAECYPEALTNYRKALSVFVRLVSDALYIENSTSLNDLNARIEKLSSSHRIHHNPFKLMELVRRAGNKGTHSEDYPDEDFCHIAIKTQDNFLKLIKTLYSIVNSGESVPKFECRLESELNIVTQSHKAIFENDTASQYLVAKKLHMHAQRILLNSSGGFANQKTIIELPNGEKETRYHDNDSTKDTAIAFRLFNACQFKIPEAAYEYGKLLLTEGHWLGEERNPEEAGIACLKQASREGVVEASSLLGKIYLHGVYGARIDVEWALEFLQEAVEQGESNATIELANYYFGIKNIELAFKYFSLSADSGSPKGQFLLAKYLMNGDLPENQAIDIDYLLREAWKAGVYETRLYLARRLSMKHGSCYCKEALSFYEEYLQRERTGSVLLECAQYMIRFKVNEAQAYHYLLDALQLSHEEEDTKLNYFLSYIVNNTQTFINQDPHAGSGIICDFPQEILLDPAKLTIQTLTDHHVPEQPRLLKPSTKLKRNDPCQCGSGKKFKKCCLN